MRISHHIIFAFVLFAGYFSHAQSEKVLTELTTDNGLSLNSVNDMLFDKQGFLWLATADGLQRFDGYRFESFRHDAAKRNSIPNNLVNGLYLDAKENLWISHYTALVVKPKDKLDFIDLSAKIKPFVINNPITVVSENDSTVWILNNPGGIFSVNKTSFVIKKIFDLPQKFFEDGYFVFSPIRSIGDRIWFRKRGVRDSDLFTITDKGIRQFSNTKKITILFLIPDGKDNLVVISDKNVFMSSVNDPFSPMIVLQDQLDPSFLDNQFITYPRPLANNQSLLVATKKVFVYNHVDRTIKPFHYTDYFHHDFPRYLLLTTKDQVGNSWFGFNGSGGVKMLPHLAQKFNHFERPDKEAMPYCLGRDYEGNIYVGIYLGGIEVYNKQGQFLQHIKLELKNLPYNSPRAIAMIDSSTLLIKSTYDDFFAYDLLTKKMRSISKIINYPTIFGGDFEPCLQQVREGEVWLSSRNNIYSITKNKNNYSSKIICSLPPLERISSFYRNPDGKLWIGSIISGWSFIDSNLARLPFNGYVKNINQDSAGNVWFATTDGIFIVQGSKVVKKLHVRDGLPNTFVYGILFDDDASAWISTNRGLARIDKQWHVTSYSANVGLQGDEFNTHGYLKGVDGTLYFAGLNGIDFFKPSDLLIKSPPFSTLLTNIEVNNNPFADSIEASMMKELTLPADQDNIRLSFAYMDFTAPEKNKFKFWLKQFQNDWSSPQTNNTVQYFLPPGKYQLLVLGSNYEGVWSKEPLVLNINILPPWYQTTIAKVVFLLVVLVVGGLSFYFIYRNRYRKKIEKLQTDQEVQREKQRLSRDLHDNLGSQITWLSNHISQLQRAEQEQQPVADRLGKLQEGTGELMQTLRETIWILNKDKVSCVDLFDKVVSLAARHIEVNPPMQLQTDEQIFPDIQLNTVQALQIFRICQEAVNNACKYAEATQLKIAAVCSKKDFTISIHDNGKGFLFSNNGIEGHYGLQNMKERAKESSLNLAISSSAEEGTTVSVTTSL